MTGGPTNVVFGETLCLPARSRFGEGRAAPLPVSLRERSGLEAFSQLHKPGNPFIWRPAVQGFGEDYIGRVATRD
jgi:hypothetical protein